jgi:hypothetical protein
MGSSLCLHLRVSADSHSWCRGQYTKQIQQHRRNQRRNYGELDARRIGHNAKTFPRILIISLLSQVDLFVE